jgi:hypothetical protein
VSGALPLGGGLLMTLCQHFTALVLLKGSANPCSPPESDAV